MTWLHRQKNKEPLYRQNKEYTIPNEHTIPKGGVQKDGAKSPAFVHCTWSFSG